MARFYAMVANGGKLVTPHLALDVEQPGDDKTPPTILRTSGLPSPSLSTPSNARGLI